MTKSSPPPAKRAFTLWEMLIVLAVIAIMMSMTYPVYQNMSQRARATQDLNNLRQIGLGLQIYVNDKDSVLPVINALPGIGTTATSVIYPKYIATKRVFQSPFDRRPPSEADDAPVSYGINQNIYDLVTGNMVKVVSPSSTILMAPNYNGSPGVSASWTGHAATAPFVPNLAPGGGGGMTTGPQFNGTQINALFCDLHAETMTFGPNGNPAVGSFKDTTTDPLGLKHWNPTK
jgi:prepilin-type N-terminal cleavage/methylation domain-containing protein